VAKSIIFGRHLAKSIIFEQSMFENNRFRHVSTRWRQKAGILFSGGYDISSGKRHTEIRFQNSVNFLQRFFFKRFCPFFVLAIFFPYLEGRDGGGRGQGARPARPQHRAEMHGLARAGAQAPANGGYFPRERLGQGVRPPSASVCKRQRREKGLSCLALRVRCLGGALL
jgi:hypothetical protein